MTRPSGDALELPPAEAKALLDRRARALSEPPRQADEGDRLRLVVFSLGAERYALEVGLVREVARLGGLTPLPRCPEFLAGVTNLRGEILPVVDMRRFFDLPGRGLSDLSRLIVVGAERAEFALLADEAHAVVAVKSAELLEPPGSVTGIGREYLRGVTQDALIVLDGRILVSDGRLSIAGTGPEKA